MEGIACETNGRQFMRWAHSLQMQCARQSTAEEVDRRVLDVDTAYNLHTRLVVHLIPMSNFVNFEKELGDGNQVVSQGALRLKSLIKYYGNGRFQVLCELDPEENCAGLPYERAVFKVSANVLGSHLNWMASVLLLCLTVCIWSKGST